MARRTVSFLLALAVVAYGFGVWLFLLHPQDRLPTGADAVFVLAGSTKRLPVALNLVEHGIGKTLVVSADNRADDPGRYAVCHAATKPKRYKVLCQTASPFSTRGEARMIADLARKNSWTRVVVVTSRYHVYRAHMLLRRCTGVNLFMRATDGDTWWQKALAVPLEYVKLARSHLTQSGC
jgi:uncharacterized SAM-binding protein YcdF (DUF218 family)